MDGQAGGRTYTYIMSEEIAMEGDDDMLGESNTYHDVDRVVINYERSDVR